jgi:GntR family transcriptional regulator, rspAB operon transcriptional repressor
MGAMFSIGLASTDRSNTIAAKAYEHIREAILTTRVKPGDGLSETEVASSMGVSRTPVREAFARLLYEGLIEIWPQSGTRVSLVDMTKVSEAIFIRTAIEASVIADGEHSADQAILDEAETALRAQERLADGSDMAALHRQDRAFHAALMRAYGYPQAWTASQYISADMVRVQFLIGMQARHVGSIIAEHRAILDYTRSGNRQAAAAALKLHVSNVDTDIAELLEIQAQYFKGTNGPSL